MTAKCVEVGYFRGIFKFNEKILANGSLFEQTSYYLKNKKTGKIIAGVGGGTELTYQHMINEVSKYYEGEPDEANEFLKEQNDNNTTQTGIHTESK